MASLRSQVVRTATQAFFSLVDAHTADVNAMRRQWHTLGRALWTASGVQTAEESIAGCHAERLTPDNAEAGALLLYLHGGAYVMGNCATHRQLVSYIARDAGVAALLPEYRLAPEHRFPAAVDDAVAIYRALLDAGQDPARLIVAGDSAGGGLSCALLLSLRDAGLPMPAAVCLLSPWLDLAATGESLRSRADADPWFKPDDLAVVAAYYCEDAELRDPLVSPVFADWHDLPPILIQVGADEILLSDSTRAAEKIRAAGGDVELEVWPDMWHVFQAFVQQMPESRRAVKQIAEYLRARLELDALPQG